MVGMGMSVDSIAKLEVVLSKEASVAVNEFVHGVYQNCLASDGVSKQISISAGLAVEKLAEDEFGRFDVVLHLRRF